MAGGHKSSKKFDVDRVQELFPRVAICDPSKRAIVAFWVKQQNMGGRRACENRNSTLDMVCFLASL